MKSGFYMTASNNQFSGWKQQLQKHFPEWNSHRRKRSWSLVVCCLSDLLQLWVLVKPLHLRSMLRKSMRCTKNCNACNWQKSPILHQVWLFNFWSIGLWRANRAIKFCLICHIRPTSRPLTTISSSILTTFCRENAFQEFVESQSTDFYATEINSLLNGKNVLIVRVPILINKDLFELSYDLKFTVRNCNYICTNLLLRHILFSKPPMNMVAFILVFTVV